MNDVFTTIKISPVECGSCGIWFGMPGNMLEKAQQDGSLFYCPKGCHIGYSKPENQRLKDELAREKQRREQVEADRNWQRDQRLADEKFYGNKIRAEKGAKTRLKNRIANGVCPCCTRTFQNLHRHIETKHPEYKEANP